MIYAGIAMNEIANITTDRYRILPFMIKNAVLTGDGSADTGMYGFGFGRNTASKQHGIWIFLFFILNP